MPTVTVTFESDAGIAAELVAVLLDSAGKIVGPWISTGFTETSSGHYTWQVALSDYQRQSAESVRFYSPSDPEVDPVETALIETNFKDGSPTRYLGDIDCSGNPNYPAADSGDLYVISVSGKIGGAAGRVVDAGDTIICRVDGTLTGTQAQRGGSWNVFEKSWGYVPENLALKSADVAADAASTTKYPAVKAIVDWVTNAVATAISGLSLGTAATHDAEDFAAAGAGFSGDAADLTGGPLPDEVFPASLPAVSGANLTGISGGASVVSKTVAEMQALVGSFIPGRLYLITDAGGDAAAILISAYDADNLSPVGAYLGDGAVRVVFYDLATDVLGVSGAYVAGDPSLLFDWLNNDGFIDVKIANPSDPNNKYGDIGLFSSGMSARGFGGANMYANFAMQSDGTVSGTYVLLYATSEPGVESRVYVRPEYITLQGKESVTLSAEASLELNAPTINVNGDPIVGATVESVQAASSIVPVDDGTYTVGLGVTTNGTITVEKGIITAIQEAS